MNDYELTVDRLSRLSLDADPSALGSIDWESPELRVSSQMSGWALPSTHPIGATSWYRSLPSSEQQLVGLHQVATACKVGVQLENILQRALLGWTATLRESSLEFRYAHHVIAEESRHSLMFREVIRRSESTPAGPRQRFAIDPLSFFDKYGDAAPAYLLLFALTFEDPFDRLCRIESRPRGRHPLLVQVSRTHISDEARHKAFARAFLQAHLGRLPDDEMRRIRRLAPFLVATTASVMLDPGSDFADRFSVPSEVVRLYSTGPAFLARRRLITRGIVEFCAQAGLIDQSTQHVWQALGFSVARDRGSRIA